KVYDVIIKNCEIQMKRELLIIIDDGKTAKKFICDNKLESYLSEIRKELNEKRIITQNFKFLREDLQEGYLHEIYSDSEDSITLTEILIDDNFIRVLLNDSSISSDETDEEILCDFLSYDEQVPCEPHILFHKNEKVEYYKQNIHKCQLNYGLTFTNEDSIKPSEKFKRAIYKAIEGIDPYISYLKLLDVFAAFGNFFAQSIVIGKKLFKYVERDIDCIEDEIEWSTIDDFRKISKKLENMLSYINNENLLVNSWVESCYQNDTKLNVIEYDDLISIYEIFEESTRSQIKMILEIHDHSNSLLKILQLPEEVRKIKKPDFKQEILMIDSVQVDASVIYYRVKFKNKLKSDNYQLYGNVTTTSGQQLSGKIIKFKAINIFGFSVNVENVLDKKINNSGKMNINWMLVGNPEIVENLHEFENLHEIFYENSYSRNLIVVETGKKVIEPSIDPNWEIHIETLPNLPLNA
ncbi:963_t:CDS:2, partial [Racocetra fulgida]